MGTIRLSEVNLRGFDLQNICTNPVSKKVPLRNAIIGLFIFGLFDKNKVSALAEEIGAGYHDSRRQEEATPYVVRMLLVAESDLLIALTGWGLKLNG